MQTAFALTAELPQVAPPKNRSIDYGPPVVESGVKQLNRVGLPGLTGAFFEDALRAALIGDVSRPKDPIGHEGGTVPDLEILGHDTFLEVKSGTTADPMRFSVRQLEDYLYQRENGGQDTLYCFVWYRGKDRDGHRTTLASLQGERGKRAIARLHDHLIRETRQALILDAQILAGMVDKLRDEIAPLYPGKTVEKVGRVLRTVVDAAINGDARGRSIVGDFAPDSANWRRVQGELPLGGYGEMFAVADARRAVPVTAIIRATHADRLIRHGGPFSQIFSERSLPKHPYRARQSAVDTPF